MSIREPDIAVGSRVLLRQVNAEAAEILLPGRVRLATCCGYAAWLYYVEPDLTPGHWIAAQRSALRLLPADVIPFPHAGLNHHPAARASGSHLDARSPAAPSPDRPCCLSLVGQPGGAHDPGDGPRVA